MKLCRFEPAGDWPAHDCDVVSDAGEIVARFQAGNPLADGFALDLSRASRHLIWSGNLADELFAAHPMTWLKPGHEAWQRWCDAIGHQLPPQNASICVLPHARHVLNDVQSALSFFRERGGDGFELALAPVLLFEPHMLNEAEDHLQRMFAALGEHVSLLMLQDIAIDAETGHAEPVAIGEGEFPIDLLSELIRMHIEPSTCVLFPHGEPSMQVDQLRLSV